MFAYFRGHRRAGSSSPPIVPPPTAKQHRRPASVANLGTYQSFSPATTQTTTSAAVPSAAQAQRFYAKPDISDELQEPQRLEEDSSPLTIPNSPPILPPIPRVAESVGDGEIHLGNTQKQRKGNKDSSSSNEGTPLHLNSVRVVPPDEQSLPAELTIDTTSSMSAPLLDISRQEATGSPTLNNAVTPGRQQKYSRPVSTAYSVNFGDDFSLHDVSPIGTGRFQDRDDAWQDNTLTQKESLIDPALRPPTMPSAAGESSQSSASSSLEKLASFGKTVLHPTTANSIRPPQRTPSQDISFDEHTVTKLTRPRRNLLNPASLLKRRKTASNMDLILDSGNVERKMKSAMILPDNYDPRIKGKGVHDFSAPRTRRIHSTNDIPALDDYRAGDSSPIEERKRQDSVPWRSQEQGSSPERARTPVFTENFEEADGSTSYAEAIRREELVNKSFLARVSGTIAHGDTIPNSTQPALDHRTISPAPSLRLTPVPDSPASPLSEPTNPLQEEQPKKMPEEDFSSQLLAPREHRTSNASRHSRFSFQMVSETSVAEEHELEEKHKRRSAEKRTESASHEDENDGDSNDDGDESVDFAGFDDQYEEEIPLVGADNELEGDVVQQPFPEAAPAEYTAMPHDAAVTPHHLVIADLESPINNSNGDPGVAAGIDEGTFDNSQSPTNDEMYFDDGQIATISRHASRPFDESVFDDPSKHFDTKRNETKQELAYGSQDSGGLGISADGGSLDQAMPGNDATDMDAYHSALASAAHKAEADGKFSRASISNANSPESHYTQPTHTDLPETRGEPSAFQIDSYGGSPAAMWSPAFGQTMDYTDMDDMDYDDDALIDAANAEVLASEDSDFYGNEFNFFGNARKGREAFSGGYFGNGAKELARHSSLRDPILTPITERSEFSRAPSYMSLASFGPPTSGNAFASPLPTPGLNEIAARFNLDSDEMSLKQLLKLRKQAFAGNAGSSGTSPSSYASSPLLMKNFPPRSHPLSPEIPEEAENSDVSSSDAEQVRRTHSRDVSGDWDHSSDTSHPSPPMPVVATQPLPFRSGPHVPPAQPQIHNGPYNHSSSPPRPFTPVTKKPKHKPRPISVLPFPMSSPLSATYPSSPPISTDSMPMPSSQLMQKFAVRPPASSATFAEREAEAQTHQRGASGDGAAAVAGCESVGYVREEDQWYLEKRRTLGSGEVIILARDLVEGGRI